MALGYCAPAADTLRSDELRVTVHETSIWNNMMPGSAPVSHALVTVTIRNMTEETVRLSGAEGLVTDALTDAPLRRFDAAFVVEDVERSETGLDPGKELQLTFRSRRGLAPLDPARHRSLFLAIRVSTSLGRDLVFRSGPVDLLIAQ